MTSNTDIGVLTGTASGTSVIHVNALLNCGAFLPSAKWEGTYNITGHSLGSRRLTRHEAVSKRGIGSRPGNGAAPLIVS